MYRRIKANSSEAGPSSVFFVDAEGTPVETGVAKGKWVHYLRAFVVAHARRERGQWGRHVETAGSTTADFWGWLSSRLQRHRTNWVVGAGMGYHLQLLRVWEQIQHGRLVFSGKAKALNPGAKTGEPTQTWQGVLCLNDPPVYISCRWANGAPVKFVGIENWTDKTLEQLAQQLGMDKPQTAGDEATDGDVAVACLSRLRVVARAFQKIVDMVSEQSLGQFRPTLAGQAYHAWRHPNLPCDVVGCNDPEVRDVEREAYHGGRTHVYFCGTLYTPNLKGAEQLAGVSPLWPSAPIAPVYHLDVTACYGSVMADNPYPVRLYKTLHGPTPAELWNYLRSYCVIAQVTVETDEVPYPVRHKGEVLWKVGLLRTTLCGPELVPALVANRVKSVGVALIYVADKPFGPFVERIWRMRQMYQLAGKPLEASLCKRLMATLHGKLAQRSPRWQLLPGVMPVYPWGIYTDWSEERKAYVLRRPIGSIVQEESAPGEPPESLPGISAYVTSYARVLMDWIREDAMRHCVVYEDADSLHVTEEGYQRLKLSGWIDDQKMGHCRVVGVTDRAVYYGRKDYQFGDKRVMAGVQRNAVQLPHGDFHQTCFSTMDSVLQGEPPPGPLAYDLTARPSHELLGAAVGPDGWTRYLVEA